MRNRIRLCALCVALSLVLILEPALGAFARPISPALAEIAEDVPSPEGGEVSAPAADSAEDAGGAEFEAKPTIQPSDEVPAPSPDADPSDAQEVPGEAIASPEPEDAEAPAPSPLPSGDAVSEITPPR